METVTVDQYSMSTLTAQGAHSIGELQEQAVAARNDFSTCEFHLFLPSFTLPPTHSHTHVTQHTTYNCILPDVQILEKNFYPVELVVLKFDYSQSFYL